MRLWRILAFTFALLFLFAARQVPDEKLHLIFCDVGQGDAALVSKGSFQVLIDTGPRNGGVLSCLSRHLAFWDRTIEVVVGTHLQADHLGELGSVISHYRVGELVLSSEQVVGATMKEVLDRVKENDIKIDIVGKGDRVSYGDMHFDVLWPGQNTDKSLVGGLTNPNERALVIQLTSPGLSVLFTSDIGVDQELALLAEGVLGPIDVLKVAHHGSKYSSSSPFVEKITPKWAVVSVGAKNSYGHPTKEALQRFDLVGARVLRTDRDGEVEFLADGKKLMLE